MSFRVLLGFDNKNNKQNYDSIVTIDEEIGNDDDKKNVDDDEISLTREEILFLRSRYMDTRAITVLKFLNNDEVMKIRENIKQRQMEERELNELLPNLENHEMEELIDAEEDIFSEGDVDVDGLECCVVEKRMYRYPFKKNIISRNIQDKQQDNINPALFFDAIDLHDRYVHYWNAKKNKNFNQVISMYKTIIQTKLITKQDKIFRMHSLVNLGILRLRTEAVKCEGEAMQCFKKGAIEYHNPVSTYYYAVALIRGDGGVKRNISKGLRLLNRSGAHGVALAYFELGNIYETGLSSYTAGSVPKNLSKSRQYYCASIQTYKENDGPLNDWSYALYASQTFFDGIFHIKTLLPTDIWHGEEDVLSSIVGSRFSWSIAGQAFLFGGAAAVSTKKEMNHFQLLPTILPSIGIIMAFFSTLHIFEVVFRNGRRRWLLHEMLNAKINAFRCQLTKGKNEISKNKVRYDCIKYEIQNVEKFLDHHSFTIRCLKILSSAIEWVLIFCSLSFFVAWLILFVEQIGTIL